MNDLPKISRLAASAPGILLATTIFVACPLPQPIDDFTLDAGVTIRPPRILVETARPSESIFLATPDCDKVEVSAAVLHEDNEEDVIARWFVDYDPGAGSGILQEDLLRGNQDPSQLRRSGTPFKFSPRAYKSKVEHVVELVVSNGFASASAGADGGAALPNRTPLPGYETQVFRWVFVLDAQNGVCDP